ncbi:MAG: VanZ family protein, partial [Phycisphaerae bacterium]
AVAWSAHGLAWRPERSRQLAPAHWPFVVGAVGLVGLIGVAEQDMLGAAAPQVSDKILHFGTFGVISLLVCYALGPQPATRWLRTRILLAVAGAAALGILVEYGQVFLASTRQFESLDIVANVLGASLMGLVWWVLTRARVAAPPEG